MLCRAGLWQAPRPPLALKGPLKVPVKRPVEFPWKVARKAPGKLKVLIVKLGAKLPSKLPSKVPWKVPLKAPLMCNRQPLAARLKHVAEQTPLEVPPRRLSPPFAGSPPKAALATRKHIGNTRVAGWQPRCPRPDDSSGMQLRRTARMPPSEKSRAKAAKAVSVKELVGLVGQPAERHVAMHRLSPSAQAACPRCNYILKSDAFLPSWVEERPSCWGGTWGVGCSICASQTRLAKKRPREGGDHRQNPRQSKWAKHEVTDITHWTVQQHGDSLGHRRACELDGRARHRTTDADRAAEPAAALDRAAIKETAAGVEETAVGVEEPTLDAAAEEELKLLRGRVPQSKDWLDAWVDSGQSFRAQGKAEDKRRQVGPKTAKARQGNLRKVRRKQVTVMAEAVRRQLRKHLKESTSITVSLDEAQRRKIVRFRCDAPAKPYYCKGIFGVLDVDRDAIDDFTEDNALASVRKLEAFLLKFCTPLGKRGQPLAPDRDLYEHILKHVRVLSADGAASERRSMFLAAKTLFKKVVLVIRDPAHAIRIAIKNPLHLDEVFGKVWEELFNKRHALVPDIQNSGKWKNLLRAIQSEVVAMPGRTDALDVVLRHFGFAKQRFDSTADPQGKLALMLLPVCTLLAFISSDERHAKEQRDRARAMMQNFTPKFCVALGVSADWGLVCQAFLRLFDKSDHDIALSRSQIRGFIETLEAMFLKGHVFMKASAPGVPRQPLATDAPLPPVCEKALRDDSVKPCFITERVEKQIRTQCVFRAGPLPVLCWGRCDEAMSKELAGRIGNVTKTVIGRLQAEFPDDTMRGWLSAFEVRLLRLAFGADPPTSVRRQVLRGISQIAGALNLDPQKAVFEYRDAASYIIAKTDKGQPLAVADARAVFGLLLDGDILAVICRKRAAPFVVLPLIVRFYISIEDGECEVERDLGTCRAELAAHSHNADGALLDDKCVLRLCGPTDGSEVVAERSGRLHLTPFTSECARIWRQTFGARMGYRNTLKQIPKRTGTWAHLKRGVLGAVARSVSASRLPALERVDGVTVFGVRRSVLKLEATDPSAGRPTSKYSTPKLEKFRERTAKKRIANPILEKGSRFCFPKFKARRAAKEAPSIAHVHRVCFLGNCGNQAVAANSGCEVCVGARRCRQAQMVVVDEMSSLHACADAAMLTHLIYIAGLGRPVVTEASWELAERRPSTLQSCSVVHHVPLALTVQRWFCCTAAFKQNFPGVVLALKACVELNKSKWKFTEPGQPLAANLRSQVTQVDAVAPLATWLQNERRIANTLGPKVFGASLI